MKGIAFLLVLGSAYIGFGWVTVHPTETDAVFHNPGQGWWYIDNALPGQLDAGRSLPYIEDGTAWGEVDAVAILSTWGQIETAEGVFDWSLVDEAVDFWASKGKRIHFRLSTEPMLMPHIGYVTGVPEWLYEAGLPYEEKDSGSWGAASLCKYPDYTHPLYFPHLKRFLKAFADRYGPYTAVEVVQLLGYGTWGEWHSGHNMPTLEVRREVLKRILDEWEAAFRPYGTLLVLSNSYEWRNDQLPKGLSVQDSPPPTYQQYIEGSAFDYAYSKPSIALWRAGLSRYVYDFFDGRLIHDYKQQRRGLVYGEMAASLGEYEKGVDNFSPRRAVDEALSFGCNWLMTPGWDISQNTLRDDYTLDSALYFHNRESQGLMQYGLRWLGARLVVSEARFTSSVRPGGTLSLLARWENRGCGRLAKPYRLEVSLLADAEVVWKGVDEHFDLTGLAAGSQLTHFTTFTLPVDLAEGEATLALALVDEEGKPAFRLALEDSDASLRCPMGTIALEKKAPEEALPLFRWTEEEGFEGESPIRKSKGDGLLYNSLPDLLPLVSEGVYRVSFRLKPLQQPTGGFANPGWYWFAARSPKGGEEATKGLFTFADLPEYGPLEQTVLLKLGAFEDYHLTWGSSPGGDFELEEVLAEPLEGEPALYEGFEEPLDILANRFALAPAHRLEQGRLVGGFWWEYTEPDREVPVLATKPEVTPLRPNTTYTASFQWEQGGGRTRGNYYFACAESASGGEASRRGFTRWMHYPDGRRRPCAFSFRTGAEADWRLVIGIRNGGELALDELLLLEEPDQSPQVSKSCFKPSQPPAPGWNSDLSSG
jgi:hypothetical protein